MKKQRLAVVGAGEMAKQVIHYADIDGRYDTVGFFADLEAGNVGLINIPYMGKTEDISEIYQKGLFDCIFIAIGYKHLHFKQSLHSKLKGKIPFATIIASPTYIDYTAKIGEDVIIYPGSIIDKEVIIEDNVLLNLGAKISHNSIIGNSSFIGVGVSISGFVNIGERCFLGTNSCVIDNINICNEVNLGASSVVTKDIITSGVYVGVPIRFIHP